MLVFHRRFLLRMKFGRRWRGSLVEIATRRGVHVTPTYISHVISGDWMSNKIERFIADALELPFGEVWPERKADRQPKRFNDVESSQST